MDGILIIDKPAGITSHDVVAWARRILKTKSIGHTGTLDPFATGVMVLLVGKATRLARFLDKDAKEYEAVVQFGYETTTGDLSGSRKDEDDKIKTEISITEVEKILPDFRGEIMQTPPMYSAKKIKGKKLYELARKGVEIERKPLQVNIFELEIISSQEIGSSLTIHNSQLSIHVVCSAGTYIRVLAEDIGRKLGVGAYLAALRRTRAGKFNLLRSVTLEELEKIAVAEKVSDILVSMNEAVSHLPEIKLSNEEILKVKNGMKFKRDEDFAENQAIRLTSESDNLAAIGFYNTDEKMIQPKTVLL